MDQTSVMLFESGVHYRNMPVRQYIYILLLSIQVPLPVLMFGEIRAFRAYFAGSRGSEGHLSIMH